MYKRIGISGCFLYAGGGPFWRNKCKYNIFYLRAWDGVVFFMALFFGEVLRWLPGVFGLGSAVGICRLAIRLRLDLQVVAGFRSTLRFWGFLLRFEVVERLIGMSVDLGGRRTVACGGKRW